MINKKQNNNKILSQHGEQREVAKQLAKKIRLEHSFNLSMRRHFGIVQRNFENDYSKHGTVFGSKKHQQDLENRLNFHYEKVSNAFLNTHQEIINDDNLSYDEEDIKKSVKINNTRNIALSASIIGITTMKSINNSINKVKNDAALNNEILSNRQIAKKAGLLFKKDSIIRSTTISTTETQKAAEGTKDIELTHIIENNPDIRINAKKWQAILDERTRFAHAMADGQVVEANSPFIVNSQQLNYPGDISLGATADNTINCRCISTPTFIKN